jgi:hypothetical protein
MIVVARRFGQLGNRLLLNAYLMAAAIEYGVEFANPCLERYAHLFPATANDVWCRYPAVDGLTAPSLMRRRVISRAVGVGARCLARLGLTRAPYRVIRLKRGETCDLRHDRFREAVASGRPVLAHGWLFYSEALVYKHADVIRQHFAIPPEAQANVDALMERIRGEADVVVGVHIRHGDYETWKGGIYFYSIEEYARAMRRIADQLPERRVAFLVCSNADCDSTGFEGLTVHFGTGHITEDMYALAASDLVVGPPSTYSRWAAFYGGKPLSHMETADHECDVVALLDSNAAA